MSNGDDEQRRESLGAVQEIKEQGSGGQQTGGVASQDSIRRGEKLREVLQRRQTENPGRSQQTGTGSPLAAQVESAGGAVGVNKADLVGRGGGGANLGRGGVGAGRGDLLKQALAKRGAGGQIGQQGRALGAEGQGGRGKLLLRILQNRGDGGAGNAAGGQGRALGAEGKGAGRGMLLQRILQNRADGGAGSAVGQQGRALGAEGKGAGRGMLLQRIRQARNSRAGGAQSGEEAQRLSELQDRVQELTQEVERLRGTQAEQPAAANATSPDSKKGARAKSRAAARQSGRATRRRKLDT